jgi:deazaflavin-dependent oxidoreductase (nitroreductase family)
MSHPNIPPNPIQQLLIRFAALAPIARINAVVFHHLDRFVMRLSKQRTSATSLATGLPLIWLTTTGARSGKARTVPLLAIEDGEKLVLIASNWGQQQHPSWYYNLLAHPDVRVQRQQAAPVAYRGREVTGAEYDRCWALAVARYAGYRAYRARTTREIPVIILEPQVGVLNV